MTLSLVLILICLFFSAYFSGIEIAFVSANRFKIELDRKQGLISAKIISWFQSKQGNFIATMLLGNNIALVIYGILMAKVLEPLFFLIYPNGVFVLLSQTIISTIIILITAEFLPKSLFRLNPNKILNYTAVINLILFVLLFIPTIITISLARLILRPFGSPSKEEEQFQFGKVDLNHYLNEFGGQDAGKVKGHEVQIFQNAIEFSTVKVRECMIPRTEIVSIDIEKSIDELIEKFTRTGLSKVLVYRDNIDNMIGYTHSYELFKEPESIKSILLPLIIAPETMLAQDVMAQFIGLQRNIAVVVDEFGGTSGIVTLEDIVEEIFGEIRDEHDLDSEIEKENDEFYMFSARLEINYLNDKYALNLPTSSEYETLGGLIISVALDIPDKGFEMKIADLNLEVAQVSDNRIELVKVYKPE